MKRLIPIIALMVFAANPCSASEKFCIVRTSDLAGIEKYELMTYDEFKEHDKSVSKEKMMFSKALMLAQKEWSKENKGEGKDFPRSAVQPRETKMMGMQYKTKEEAQEKLDYYLAEPQRDADREKKRQENQKKMNTGGNSRNNRANTTSSQSKNEKKKASDAKKNAFYLEARTFFTQKLEAVKEAAASSSTSTTKPAEEEEQPK